MVKDNPGLAQFVGTSAGLTAKEAMNYAGLKLELLRDKSLAEIDDALDGISGYLRLLKDTPPLAVEQELHRLACAILNLAGTYGFDGLSKAAYSLCALIDERATRGQWDRTGVDVHFDAMRLLRYPESVRDSMQERLLDGLAKVATRKDGG